MRKSIFLLALFAVALVSCSKKGNKNNDNMNMQDSTQMSQGTMTNGQVMADSADFVADLSGDNEAPQAVNSDASGHAYFRVNSDTTQVMYTLTVNNAKNVIMAHIHYGVSGKNGPIAIWLYPGTSMQQKKLKNGMTNGVLKSGTITESAFEGGPMEGKTIKDLVQAIQHDSTYVNVHTKAHPEGEIRGAVKGSGMMNDSMNQ